MLSMWESIVWTNGCRWRSTSWEIFSVGPRSHRYGVLVYFLEEVQLLGSWRFILFEGQVVLGSLIYGASLVHGGHVSVDSFCQLWCGVLVYLSVDFLIQHVFVCVFHYYSRAFVGTLDDQVLAGCQSV